MKINKRIDALDYLRGFALLGIILVNVEGIRSLHISPPESAVDAIYVSFLSLFIEGKFFAIFSTLFGIGFYIFMDRAKQKSQNEYALFGRRLLILLIFGILHSLLQPGEALKIYAITGISLFVFYHFKKQLNLVIGALSLLITLVLDAKVLTVLPYFILGLSIGQYGWIYKMSIKSKGWYIAWTVSLVTAIISFIVLTVYYALPNYIWAEKSGIDVETYAQNKTLFNHFVLLTSPFISSFYVISLILLVQTQFGQRLLSPLKYYGRMALTNYIGQTLLIFAYSSFIIRTEISWIHSLLMCLVIYFLQIIFSVYWLKCFTNGPLEYVWRIGTYLKVLKLKK
ncbi:DUF418 domain-containing protein [Staphylococcus aureus]|uniref:DUF418 domain-containing protein n=1 Tax=Staphylococcus aureus TaxID=1280 RepID=UPI0019DF9C81|nr:DUF418 domain-containing protein [Staphylococcus aureus]HDN3485309.1 DUF418 domain-containing protein [Staphylococcus aureus]HEB5836679.1 DUF418 domain-containing protein [Staphylococcus aureus]HEB5839709.1 DUF418 domain-containing protein [Staphylococcus aureus]HEB5841982.1 DUF418 domain-containing protein [Staphylococcus aureus]